MKKYKDLSEKEPQIVSDVAVAVSQPYLTAAPEFKIPRDANGNHIGHTLAEFSDKFLDKLSKAYGVDFRKL
ncbi:MAG: hypothetical protein LBN93_08910 [Candidatus Symbiothrix sp.]|jgi:hypothetical protein|nr:hypothetical protein [Candidatus Symbiothrix sp.]